MLFLTGHDHCCFAWPFMIIANTIVTQHLNRKRIFIPPRLRAKSTIYFRYCMRITCDWTVKLTRSALSVRTFLVLCWSDVPADTFHSPLTIRFNTSTYQDIVSWE